MANKNSFKSASYYDYQLLHDMSSSANASGFYKVPKENITLSNMTGDGDADKDSQYIKEDEATSENGYITPYEYYKETSHVVDSRTEADNGMPQKQDAEVDDTHFFKDCYWWCEDLHNWCIYKFDGLGWTDKYINEFYLHSWNGKNAWVPLCNGWGVNPGNSAEYDISYMNLQNNIIQKKLNNGDFINIERGRHVNKKDIIHREYGSGPLTVNHALKLTKQDKYSINSDNRFQTERWSSNKHINSVDEYTEFNDLTNPNAINASIYGVHIKVRHKFAKTDTFRKFGNTYHDDEKEPFNSNTLTDSTFYQGHYWSLCERDSEKSSQKNNYVVRDPSKDGSGKLRYENVNHSNGFNDYDATSGEHMIFYTNKFKDIKNPYNKDNSPDFYRDYGPDDMEFPIDVRIIKGSHIVMGPFAAEKVYAVYFLNSNGTLLPCTHAQESDADDEYDILKYTKPDGTEGICHPIYMSYMDISFLFYKSYTVNNVEFRMPGRNGGDVTYVFSYEQWKIKNGAIVNAILRTLLPDYEALGYFDDVDPTKGEKGKNYRKFIEKYIDTMRCTSVLSAIYNLDEERDEANDTISKKIGIIYFTDYAYNRNVHDSFWEMVGYKDGIGAGGIAANAATVAVAGYANMYVAVWVPAVAIIDWMTGGSLASAISTTIASWFGRDKNLVDLPDRRFDCLWYKIDTANHTVTLDKKSRTDNGSYVDDPSEAYYDGITESVRAWYNNKRMFDENSLIEDFDIPSLSYRSVALYIPTTFAGTMSSLREGIPIGNPAVMRLPTGEIALSLWMSWGGENNMIGGPNVEKQYTNAIDFLNNQCKEYFGDGNTKTIDDDWLKEYNCETDEEGSSNTLLALDTHLQNGYIFEQINNVTNNDFSLTVNTYRPNITIETSGKNIDVAKKW